MTETVTVSNVIAIASLVFEIWLATERHTHTHTHTRKVCKAVLLHKKPISRILKSLKKFLESTLGQKQKKEKTEGATGLDRITRKQVESWNQMTALRFRAGEDIRTARPPFGPIQIKIGGALIK